MAIKLSGWQLSVGHPLGSSGYFKQHPKQAVEDLSVLHSLNCVALYHEVLLKIKKDCHLHEYVL